MKNKTFMLLAAGRGNRMGDLTKNIPKPLLNFHGKPLIEWHLEKLKNLGMKDVVINIAYLSEKIKAHIGDGSKWNLNVIFSEEKPVLETAGGIKFALDLIPSDPFVVINSDIFTEYNYKKLNDFDLPKNKEAFLCLVKNPEHNLKGDFTLDFMGNVIMKVNEDTKTFSGMGVYRKSFFKDVKNNSFYKLSSLLETQIRKKNVCGCLINDLWLDIGTPERLISPINKKVI
ncbi:MAG: nucleotidyltransferase family protein [Methylophilaceae bacterium]